MVTTFFVRLRLALLLRLVGLPGRDPGREPARDPGREGGRDLRPPPPPKRAFLRSDCPMGTWCSRKGLIETSGPIFATCLIGDTLRRFRLLSALVNDGVSGCRPFACRPLVGVLGTWGAALVAIVSSSCPRVYPICKAGRKATRVTCRTQFLLKILI